MNTDTSPQDVPHFGSETPPQRFLKLRSILKSWFGRILLYCISLALLFVTIMLAQRSFVRRQVYRTADLELDSWAQQVIEEVGYHEKWDLKGFRNAVITVPSWYVLTDDGVTVDIEGSLPGLFGKATPLGESIYDSPQSVTSTTGEVWRLLRKKLDGGIVIVGISAPDTLNEADHNLVASISKFGSTIDEATSVRSRDIAYAIDYAVLNSSGDITNAFGGIPLKTSLRISPGADNRATINANAHSYRLYFKPITDQSHRHVGMVIIPRDMTLEEQAMDTQNRFNASLVLGTLSAAIVLTLVVLRKLSQRPALLALEDALVTGETKTIEFKGSFQWDINQGKQNVDLRLQVLKSIAGFLNSDGGHLFIGLAEDRSGQITMRGIDDDLKLLGRSRDKLLLTLRNLITTNIGSEFAPFISERFEERDQLTFLIVDVLSSPSPAFLRWKERTSFYVREGPKTSDLDTERAVRYIKNKWH